MNSNEDLDLGNRITDSEWLESAGWNPDWGPLFAFDGLQPAQHSTEAQDGGRDPSDLTNWPEWFWDEALLDAHILPGFAQVVFISRLSEFPTTDRSRTTLRPAFLPRFTT